MDGEQATTSSHASGVPRPSLYISPLYWFVTAILCGVSMWRVDWEQEAVEAQKQSIALQGERLLQGSACDEDDVENNSHRDGTPQGSLLPGGEFAAEPSYGLCHAPPAMGCAIPLCSAWQEYQMCHARSSSVAADCVHTESLICKVCKRVCSMRRILNNADGANVAVW